MNSNSSFCDTEQGVHSREQVNEQKGAKTVGCKITQENKGPERVETILKEIDTFRKLTLFDFNIYYKVTVVTRMW